MIFDPVFWMFMAVALTGGALVTALEGVLNHYRPNGGHTPKGWARICRKDAARAEKRRLKDLNTARKILAAHPFEECVEGAGVEYWRCPSACGEVLNRKSAEDHRCLAFTGFWVDAIWNDRFARFSGTADQLLKRAAQEGSIPYAWSRTSRIAKGGGGKQPPVWKPMWVCEYRPVPDKPVPMPEHGLRCSICSGEMSGHTDFVRHISYYNEQLRKSLREA